MTRRRDHRPLVVGEGRDQRVGPLGPDVGQRFVLDVAGRADVVVRRERDRLRATLATAGVVDQRCGGRW